MAIIAPSDLPIILKVDSNPLKKYILSQLGHPVTLVEFTEDQFESVLKVTGDFISQYFPKEELFAVFQTTPLQAVYDLPADAVLVRDVAWDPATTRIDDIFGAESFLFNIGNISGIQNILTDFHLLQAYRKFSQKVLGTEGQWEVLGDNKLRLYPTPRGTFGVVIKYQPFTTQFRTPEARWMANQAMLAETKIMVGRSRSKFQSIPGPDGGSITLNGADLVREGEEEKKNLAEQANLLGEPLPIILW